MIYVRFFFIISVILLIISLKYSDGNKIHDNFICELILRLCDLISDVRIVNFRPYVMEAFRIMLDQTLEDEYYTKIINQLIEFKLYDKGGVDLCSDTMRYFLINKNGFKIVHGFLHHIIGSHFIGSHFLLSLTPVNPDLDVSFTQRVQDGLKNEILDAIHLVEQIKKEKSESRYEEELTKRFEDLDDLTSSKEMCSLSGYLVNRVCAPTHSEILDAKIKSIHSWLHPIDMYLSTSNKSTLNHNIFQELEICFGKYSFALLHLVNHIQVLNMKHRPKLHKFAHTPIQLIHEIYFDIDDIDDGYDSLPSFSGDEDDEDDDEDLNTDEIILGNKLLFEYVATSPNRIVDAGCTHMKQIFIYMLDYDHKSNSLDTLCMNTLLECLNIMLADEKEFPLWVKKNPKSLIRNLRKYNTFYEYLNRCCFNEKLILLQNPKLLLEQYNLEIETETRIEDVHNIKLEFNKHFSFLL